MYILLVSCCRGPDFDTELFGEKGVTVQKLLEELYEKVSLHNELAFNNRLQARYSAEPIRDQYRFNANVFC